MEPRNTIYDLLFPSQKDEPLSHIPPKALAKQLELHQKGNCFLHLEKACTAADGIWQLDKEFQQQCMKEYEKATRSQKITKFVPASGAASKLFQTLNALNNTYHQIDKRMVSQSDPYTEKNLHWFRDFMENIRKFPFYPDLKMHLKNKKEDLEKLIQKGEYKEILKSILESDGLGYGRIPKALIKVRLYPEGQSGNLMEEQVFQDISYLLHQNGTIRLHFTTSANNLTVFQIAIQEILEKFNGLNIKPEIDISVQNPETDSIAVDLENKPFLDFSGQFLYSPGGHGALLENLNRIHSDLIFIKNIDDVCLSDHAKKYLEWQKVLGGFLLLKQNEIFSLIHKLLQPDCPKEVQNKAFHFLQCNHIVSIKEPPDKTTLLEILDRPIRVCAVIAKENQMGNMPFWVTEENGKQSLQLVSPDQVNFDNPQQELLFAESEYLSPCHIVISPTNYKGEKFNLPDFQNEELPHIRFSSYQGEPIKILEKPGLWNGGMSNWNSFFVEVPRETFYPIRNLMDLI